MKSTRLPVSAILRRLLLLAFLLIGAHVPASAAVEISFYSREMQGDNFPHAFVVLRGTVDGTGACAHGTVATGMSPLPCIVWRNTPKHTAWT